MKTAFFAMGILMAAVFALPAHAIQTEGGEMDAMRAWADPAAPPPFSFQYDGKAVAPGMIDWKTMQKMEGDTSQRTWICPNTGLEVRLEGRKYADMPVFEYVVYLKNTGAADTPLIENIQALDMNLPFTGSDPCIRYAKGATCSFEDYRPMMRRLNKGGQMHVTPNGGRSSSDFMPFFNIEREGAPGIIVGIGWSGEWAADFQRPKEGTAFQVRCGMARTHLILHPGEEIRTPRIAVLFYQNGDWVRGQNLLRKFILAYHRPQTSDGPLKPIILNGNWGGTCAETHLKNIKAITDHDLPVDYYWIDAEWFGQGKWHQTAGDWTPKSDLYPQGFKPLADALHASGRKLLLWFEPERVCERTPWYQEHAPWLLDVPKEQRHYNWGTSQAEPDWVAWESARNQIVENDRLFNLAIPEARAFLTDFISNKITEFGLDCFRHDANIAPLEFLRAADAPDRQGMTEIRWVEGLYAFWDALLERHPGLIIDNCASGGRRIDLESLSRSTPYWRTDHPAGPTVKQCHTYGMSFWAPLNATGAVNPSKESAYNVRSTWSGSLVMELFGGGDAAKNDPEYAAFNYEQAKGALEQYRAISHYFLGDYYPITEYSQAEDAWMAWQFHRDDLEEGLLQVFRRPKSICTTGCLLLKGLSAERTYRIENLDTKEIMEVSGKGLMEKGLSVTLTEKPGSAVFVYRAL